ncbi:MAG: hypothetical protein WBA46_00365 [Thermomicrobiales bacterium]
MVTTTSRRSVARGALGGVAAWIGLKGIAAAAPAGKVDICHYSASTNTFAPISVSANAVSAHMAHGDEICTNPDNGTSSCQPSGCTVTCDTGYLPCSTGCCAFPPPGSCWWMENFGNLDWVPANLGYDECKAADSCSGGGGQSGGGCYKWTVGQNDPFTSWPF